jgi:glycosyltransferase involved in cell wall biosynthesis
MVLKENMQLSDNSRGNVLHQTKKIKILIFTHSLHIGGAEKHIYGLVSCMDKDKYQFRIICLYTLGAIGEMLLNENKNVGIYHAIMKNKFDIFGVLKLIRIIMKERIDILYIMHTPLTLFWGIFCAKIAGIKATVTRFTSTYPIYHVKRRKVVNYFMLSFIDKIIAQAVYHRQYLINHEGATPKKIVVIYNSVDIHRFTQPKNIVEMKEAIGISKDAQVVGIIANLRPEKGHKVFLEAAQRILNSCSQASFLIVGEGKQRGNLEKITEELKIHSNVHFAGLRKDIPELISLFDVAVLASNDRVETFSNAVLEYMAAAKPVVATKVGSIAEQVIDGETGFLVPYGDSKALAEAILKLLMNKDLAVKMGEAGRAMVREKFTVQKMIANYEDLFSDMLKHANFIHAGDK